MTRDDAKLNYASDWDIDQQLDTNDVAVTAGDTAIYAIPPTSVLLPVCEVQFKPGGSTKFYQAGTYATSNTLATSSTFYSYISGGSLWIHTTTNGIARYYIYADRLDY